MGKFGGAQPGAGRPKGSKSSKTIELAQAALAQGISPVEVLLNDMRFFYNLGEKRMRDAERAKPGEEQQKTFTHALGIKAIARECARDAAPYVHPKLASIQGAVTVTNVEAELAELE